MYFPQRASISGHYYCSHFWSLSSQNKLACQWLSKALQEWIMRQVRSEGIQVESRSTLFSGNVMWVTRWHVAPGYCSGLCGSRARTWLGRMPGRGHCSMQNWGSLVISKGEESWVGGRILSRLEASVHSLVSWTWAFTNQWDGLSFHTYPVTKHDRNCGKGLDSHS